MKSNIQIIQESLEVFQKQKKKTPIVRSLVNAMHEALKKANYYTVTTQWDVPEVEENDLLNLELRFKHDQEVMTLIDIARHAGGAIEDKEEELRDKRAAFEALIKEVETLEKYAVEAEENQFVTLTAIKNGLEDIRQRMNREI